MSAGDAREPDAAPDLSVAIRFQRDLYLYWRGADEARGLPLTARGYVVRPALRRLRTLLAVGGPPFDAGADPTEGEDARLFFIRRQLERLGLLRAPEADEGARRLVAAERASMARYLERPLAERLRLCARLWVAGGWWPDMPDARVEPPRLLTPAPPRLALARRRLLEQLAASPIGVEAPLPGASRIPARSAGQPRAQAQPTPAESETHRAALLGPLAWLGFVAPSGEPAPGAYRTLPATQALREPGALSDAFDLAETAGRVVAQSNFALLAFPPLTAPELLLLDSCAELVALDATARYTLTRDALARARRLGLSAQEVAARLEALAAAPLPANVRVTLADWERQSQRLRLTRDATLLTVREAALLDALLADRAAAGWVARRLSPTVALLAPGAALRVRAWLLRRGELPALN